MKHLKTYKLFESINRDVKRKSKKKRTRIRKVSDSTYNWIPTTNFVSPSPIPTTTISQIKL